MSTGTEFMVAGLCAQTDPDAFHPAKREPTAEARAICRRCPVLDECLEYALVHDERFGIWGGTSARERDQLRRRQARTTRSENQRTDRREAARRMHAAGRSKNDIARVLRVSGATLNSYLAN